MNNMLTRSLFRWWHHSVSPGPAGERRCRGVRFEQLETRDLLATINLPPIADNTLYESTDTNISNGAGVPATLNSATRRYRFFNGSLWPVAGGSFADQDVRWKRLR